MKERQKIIEYDSPEKREQRERMLKYERDLKVQLAGKPRTDSGANVPKKKDEKAVMETIGKLYQAEQKKENVITKLRHEKELKECQELKEKPDINHNYKLTRSRTPVHLRTNEELSEKFDEILRMKRDLEEKKQREVESECTFNPRTSNMEPLSDPMHTVEKLLKWKQEKDLETIKRVALEANKEDETFHPKINPKSRQLARNRRRSEEAIHERLVHLKEKRDRAIEDIVIEEQKKLFNPNINKNSMKILERKKKILEGDGTEVVRQKFLVEETDNAKYLRSEQVKSPAKDLLRLTIQESRKLRKERREKETQPQPAKKNDQYANIKSRYKALANQKPNRASRSASKTRSRSVKRASSKIPIGYQSERKMAPVTSGPSLRNSQAAFRPSFAQQQDLKRATSRSRSKSARSLSRSKSVGSRRRPSQSSRQSRTPYNQLARSREFTDGEEEVEIVIDEDSPSRSASRKKQPFSPKTSELPKRSSVPKIKSTLDVRVSQLAKKNAKEKLAVPNDRQPSRKRNASPEAEFEVEIGTQSPREISPGKSSQRSESAPKKSSLKKQSRFESSQHEGIFVQPNRHGRNPYKQSEPDQARSQKVVSPKGSKIFFQSQAEAPLPPSPQEQPKRRAEKTQKPKASPPEIRWKQQLEGLDASSPAADPKLVQSDPFAVLDRMSASQQSGMGGWSVEEVVGRPLQQRQQQQQKEVHKPRQELEDSRSSHIKLEGHRDLPDSPETPKYPGDVQNNNSDRDHVARQLKKLQIKEVFTNMYFD